MSSAGGKTRLETWKEIAGYFGKDERTVRRWEDERGLPVHRLPGQSRSRIYAETAELDRWLRQSGELEPEAPAVAPTSLASPAAKPLRLGWVLQRSAAGVALAAVTAGLTVVVWSVWHALPASPPPLEAQRLYLKGMDDFRQRTPESLTRAVEEFTAAAAKAPRYAEAYVGLAETYNLLREFTLMPSKEAYPLAEAAARKALSLNDRLAEGHASLAFIDAYGRLDASGARREFKRALALDANSAQTHHWYGSFLLSQGEPETALHEYDEALRLDPTGKAVRADRAVALNELGRKEEAYAELKALEARDPTFLAPPKYISSIALEQARDSEFLSEGERAANLTGDRQRLALLAEAKLGFAEGGHQGLLRRLAAEEERQFKLGVVPRSMWPWPTRRSTTRPRPTPTCASPSIVATRRSPISRNGARAWRGSWATRKSRSSNARSGARGLGSRSACRRPDTFKSWLIDNRRRVLVLTN